MEQLQYVKPQEPKIVVMPRWLTTEQIKLFFNISRKTAEKLVYERKIKRKKVGIHWLYSLEKLEQFFAK